MYVQEFLKRLEWTTVKPNQKMWSRDVQGGSFGTPFLQVQTAPPGCGVWAPDWGIELLDAPDRAWDEIAQQQRFRIIIGGSDVSMLSDLVVGLSKRGKPAI